MACRPTTAPAFPASPWRAAVRSAWQTLCRWTPHGYRQWRDWLGPGRDTPGPDAPGRYIPNGGGPGLVSRLVFKTRSPG